MKKEKFDMQISKIFSIVLGLHLLVFSMLLIVPGCVTTEGGSIATEPVKPGGETMKSSPRVQPPSTRLDPAFNAGLASGSSRRTAKGGRYPPMRPTAELETDSILEPLGDLIDTSYSTYTVQSGDSPWLIANAYGIPLDDLLRANGFTRETTIYVGQEIVIPGDATREGSGDAPVDFSILDSENEYMVEPGDTLSGIAARYNVNINAIKGINNLSSDVILLGQILQIPSVGNYTPESINISEERLTDPSALGNENIHIVQEGDTPNLIARMYGLKTEDLMRINKISDPRKLQLGQSLLIVLPGSTDESPSITPSIETEREESEPDLFAFPDWEDSQPPSVEDLERSLLEEEDKIPVIPIESESSI